MNSKRKTSVLWPYPLVLGVIALIVSASNNASGWLSILIVLIAIFCTVYLYYRDQLRKTTVLLYELEPSVEQSYRAVHDIFDEIRRCGAVWHIGAEGTVKDRKYHAGASTLVQRKAINLGMGQPPYVKTNLSIPTLPVGKQTLYFFPDRLLVFTSNGVGAVSYDSLNVGISSARFVEEERVPHDSQIVDRTWKYVNKKGGPDRRFKDNRELPIVMYEQMLLGSQTGLNELIQLSKVGVGSGLSQAVATLEQCCKPMKSPEKGMTG